MPRSITAALAAVLFVAAGVAGAAAQSQPQSNQQQNFWNAQASYLAEHPDPVQSYSRSQGGILQSGAHGTRQSTGAWAPNLDMNQPNAGE